MLCNVYVDGSTDENGPLVVFPRRISDPWAPPTAPENASGEAGWDGAQVVYMPPGSACIFDQALFHCARAPFAGSSPVRRYIFGGHYTGWHNRRRHREDNFYQQCEELAPFENEHPLL